MSSGTVWRSSRGTRPHPRFPSRARTPTALTRTSQRRFLAVFPSPRVRPRARATPRTFPRPKEMEMSPTLRRRRLETERPPRKSAICSPRGWSWRTCVRRRRRFEVQRNSRLRRRNKRRAGKGKSPRTRRRERTKIETKYKRRLPTCGSANRRCWRRSTISPTGNEKYHRYCSCTRNYRLAKMTLWLRKTRRPRRRKRRGSRLKSCKTKKRRATLLFAKAKKPSRLHKGNGGKPRKISSFWNTGACRFWTSFLSGRRRAGKRSTKSRLRLNTTHKQTSGCFPSAPPSRTRLKSLKKNARTSRRF
mmetsp:Transcript_369/g.1459  ORF Transcript_369/g.1459 Transcript_369/m.1459 type:complete len:304 (-) Transcript_369:11168-12079(-)